MNLLFKLDDWEIREKKYYSWWTRKSFSILYVYHKNHYSGPIIFKPFDVLKLNGCARCKESVPKEIRIRGNFYRYLNELL